MIKLDVGCGGRGSRQPGFIGIDIHPVPYPVSKDRNNYVRMDFVCDDLPWKDGTVDEIIALHIIEHLIPKDGERLVQRAYSLLRPEAQLTITCPDLSILCGAYMAHDIQFLSKRHLNAGKEIWPGPTIADRLNWAIHQETHKWSYDYESLFALVKRAIPGIRPPGFYRMPKNHKWSTRPDHETGIVIVKGAE